MSHLHNNARTLFEGTPCGPGEVVASQVEYTTVILFLILYDYGFEMRNPSQDAIRE